MRADLAAFSPEALPHWDESFVSMAIPRPEFAREAFDGDRAMHGARTPARARQSAATAAAASAASGLVSVPTSGPRGSTPLELGELREALGAFSTDVQARRLALLRMNVGFAARAHAVSERGHRSDVPWMVTLTYANPDAWEARHVSDALAAVRKWAKRAGFALRYVWVAEIQEGRLRKHGDAVLHYHLCIWLPRGQRMPKWDVRGWWPHGMSQRIVARHAVAYLMKYLSKGSVYALLPRGARTYGVGGLDHSLRRARRWLRLPAFVQGNSSIMDPWRRAVGGGWVDGDGQIWPSEFTATIVGGQRVLSRVFTHARAIEASGPFSWLSDRAVSCAVH